VLVLHLPYQASTLGWTFGGHSCSSSGPKSLSDTGSLGVSSPHFGQRYKNLPTYICLSSMFPPMPSRQPLPIV
jgi:hypothetical protein